MARHSTTRSMLSRRSPKPTPGLPWPGSWPGNGMTTAVGRLAEHHSCGPEEAGVMPNPVDLEPQAKAVVDANANPPYLFELGPDQGRRTIDAVQSGPVKKLTVDLEDTTVPGGPSGQVSVRILRPQGIPRPLAVIIYLHGAGWVFGNHHTHDRLIRELAVGAQAAVVFPNYSRSPGGQVPHGHPRVL